MLLLLSGILAFTSTLMPWVAGLSLWDLDTLERVFSEPDAGPLYSVNTAATSLVVCGVLCMLCGVVGLVATHPDVLARWRRVGRYATAGLMVACVGALFVIGDALEESDDVGSGVAAVIIATVVGLYGSVLFERSGRSD
ncbi:monovalent cation/H(+) antiporter subunit G [Streptomyces aculeolatus]